MTIVERVREYISTDLGSSVRPDLLTPDLALIDDGVLDSMGMLELMTFLEREFGIDIDDSDLTYDNFHDLDAISNLVRARRRVEAEATSPAAGD